MGLSMHLVGSKWGKNKETLDGYKVIRVELELAGWENNDKLFDYLSRTFFSDFPLPGSQLYESDLDEIVRILSNQPALIYGDDLAQAKKDLVVFTNVRDWLKLNLPYARVEFDVACNPFQEEIL